MRSGDAFPRYAFADGVFDVGLHIGDDYHLERWDQTIDDERIAPYVPSECVPQALSCAASF